MVVVCHVSRLHFQSGVVSVQNYRDSIYVQYVRGMYSRTRRAATFPHLCRVSIESIHGTNSQDNTVTPLGRIDSGEVAKTPSDASYTMGKIPTKIYPRPPFSLCVCTPSLGFGENLPRKFVPRGELSYHPV